MYARWEPDYDPPLLMVTIWNRIPSEFYGRSVYGGYHGGIPTRWITMPTLKEALLAAAILCFAGADIRAAEIHDGDTGYIANNSIWFTNESDLSVWKRMRQAFAPKDVKTYQQIILEERQAWQFISGPIKVKVLSYWANQHKINVKMLTEGRLADCEWWVEDKDYSNTK
jgi:hypothetical protein